MKDDMNGSIVGKFESNEYGKFTLTANDIKKDFYIGVTNSKELEQVISTDYVINSLKNNQFLYSTTWLGNSIPTIVEVYNENNISGNNWVGIIEKKFKKMIYL